MAIGSFGGEDQGKETGTFGIGVGELVIGDW